jgi:choline dehydrogenase-like flavoprotein
MLEMQFATGAKSARPAHKQARHYGSWKEAKAAVAELEVVPHKATVGSAHVMGGCPMGDDEKRSVTDCEGKLRHLEHLYVMDGSLFPTSIGANPQLSIYGLVYKLASKLGTRLGA